MTTTPPAAAPRVRGRTPVAPLPTSDHGTAEGHRPTAIGATPNDPSQSGTFSVATNGTFSAAIDTAGYRGSRRTQL